MADPSADLTAEPEASDYLYERCNRALVDFDEGVRKSFNQDDLLSLCTEDDHLKHVTDRLLLMPLINDLLNRQLFLSRKGKSGFYWALRPREAAVAVRRLSTDERMVYMAIEDSYTEGIWIRNIKKRTGAGDTNVDNAIKKLIQMNLIKSIKNIRNPMQKTYMLQHLAASDDVTGGSFYDAGDLDQSLVAELGNLIVFHVRQASWADGRRKRPKRETSPIRVPEDDDPVPESPHRKRKRDITTTTQPKDIEDGATAPARKHRKRLHDHTEPALQLAYPAGHKYPTTADLHSFITTNNIIRSIKARQLGVDEVQTLINVLVWDGKLEKVNGGYRTVRGVKPRGEMGEDRDEDARKRGNGWTEMPCGRCPVFDLCRPGGPISAENCVYFERWLKEF